MKVLPIFYFILFFCFTFSGCKKNDITPNSITGQWYVERYTVYNNVSTYNSGFYDYEPMENYESVGLFNFNDDGTGVYTFENQVVPFNYTISESIRTYNGYNKTPNDNSVILKFDKSAISSLRSPILEDYYRYDVEFYEVFTRTENTLRFRAEYDYANFVYNESKIEFVLTRQ